MLQPRKTPSPNPFTCRARGPGGPQTHTPLAPFGWVKELHLGLCLGPKEEGLQSERTKTRVTLFFPLKRARHSARKRGENGLTCTGNLCPCQTGRGACGDPAVWQNRGRQPATPPGARRSPPGPSRLPGSLEKDKAAECYAAPRPDGACRTAGAAGHLANTKEALSPANKPVFHQAGPFRHPPAGAEPHDWLGKDAFPKLMK